MNRVFAFALVASFVALISMVGVKAATLHSQDPGDHFFSDKIDQGEETADQQFEGTGDSNRTQLRQSQRRSDQVQQGNSQQALEAYIQSRSNNNQSNKWPRVNSSGVNLVQDSPNVFLSSRNVLNSGNSKTGKAYQALKNAASDEEQREAEKDLRDALEEEYSKSLEAYEEHLQVLADKLKRLEAELDKRRDAKNELVDLRLKTLVNQARGLGWPGQSDYQGLNQNSFFYRVQPGKVQSGFDVEFGNLNKQNNFELNRLAR